MSSCVCHTNDCLLCEAHLQEGLSAEQACEIQGLLRRHTIQPHEILFRQGESSDWLYVVRAGQLKLTVTGPDGRDQIIRVAVAGQLIGYDAVDDLRHPYTATALTPGRLCGLRHRDMLRVMEQNVEVSRRLVQLLNQELSQAQALIHILGQKSSAEKIALFLLSLVPEDGAGDPQPELPLPLSRQEMADMLGLTVETVSRLMAELKRERIIEAPRGRIRILDRKGLQAYASTSPLGTAHLVQ
jgi:CRP/FNR family transcriptional regulator